MSEAPSSDPRSGPADLVLHGGAVYTVDAAGRWAEAVAVRGGRIVAVGADHELRPWMGRRTEVIDLQGRMLLPGFQDAHVHPPSGGLEMLQCDLSGVFSREEYQRMVRAYAEEHPDSAWIQGGGWSMDVFPGGAPPKEDLDSVVPDRPAYLTSRDGHSAWVNSRGLEMAGVTRETKDPPDGRIERTGSGDPAGTLHEGAMDLVERHLPPTAEEDWLEALRVAQRHLHSLGITAWQDAIVGGSYETLDAYVLAAEREELTARVVGALWWDRHRGEEQVDELLEKRERGTVGRFRATSVKIMQDGICENFTAGVLEPYLDSEGRPTDERGKSFVDPEALKAYVTRLDLEGFQVHFHAIGERAVRECLDAVEAARRANGMNDLRHHIAHLQIVHPQDIRRFRALGVVANAQPLWANYDRQQVELNIPFLGPERATWQYPFGSLVRAGAVLAFGSDWSVSSPNPMEEMAIAVGRIGPTRLEPMLGTRSVTEVFLPEERLDLPTAIRAFTMGSAFVNHLDGETGSVEIGKLADLVVVEQDLFGLEPGEFFEAKVSLTLVGGEPVFEEPRLR